MALGTFRAGLSSSAKAFWKCFHGYSHMYVSMVINSKSNQGIGEMPQSVFDTQAGGSGPPHRDPGSVVVRTWNLSTREAEIGV